MNRRLPIVTLVAVMIALATGGSAEPKASPGDTQDVVFLSNARPVLLRLHILIDGQPFTEVYRHAWDDYVKALFRHLDRDGDGFLSEAEAQRLPPPVQPIGVASRPTNVAFNFRVVDANGDGKLDLAEVAAYYRDYGSDALQISLVPNAAPASRQANAELFARLDANKDGKLSREELGNAVALMALDRDDDELISPQELAPAEATTNLRAQQFLVASPRPRAGSVESAFVFRGYGEGTVPLAARLQKKYGDGDKANLDRPPDVELRLRLGTLQPGEKPLEILKQNDAACSVQLTDAGFTLWAPDSAALVTFHLNENRPALTEQARQLVLDQFDAADVTKKGYLTAKEAQLRGFFPQIFDLLDRDLDGKLTKQELLDYLANVQVPQARALTSIVSVLASDAGHDLFDLLDADHDGRLGLWELRTAPRVLAQVGQREFLARDPMPTSYHLALGLSQASFKRAAGTFSPRGLPLLTLDSSRPGLTWFHKMDRNRDGFVSLREFLGPIDAFRKLDTNGDGLISVEEALAAQMDCLHCTPHTPPPPF
jgi:Ca2+-binding EF-hand superfamily protein